MAEYAVFVIGGDDDEQIILVDDTIENNCRLTCYVRNETCQVEESDFFEALRTIRRHALEPKGLIPVCYGASLRVWPSPMSRDMGRGLKAYKIEIGTPAGDLVSIFDEGPDVIPSKVDAQEEFAREWFASLRS